MVDQSSQDLETEDNNDEDRTAPTIVSIKKKNILSAGNLVKEYA